MCRRVRARRYPDPWRGAPPSWDGTSGIVRIPRYARTHWRRWDRRDEPGLEPGGCNAGGYGGGDSGWKGWGGYGGEDSCGGGGCGGGGDRLTQGTNRPGSLPTRFPP